jgi:hypothetical protein
LFGDDKRDGWLTVQKSFRALFLRAVFDVADVADLDAVSAARRNGDIIKLRRV